LLQLSSIGTVLKIPSPKEPDSYILDHSRRAISTSSLLWIGYVPSIMKLAVRRVFETRLCGVVLSC